MLASPELTWKPDFERRQVNKTGQSVVFEPKTIGSV